MAAEWFARDDKDNLRGEVALIFPLTVKNYSRQTAIVESKEELFRHLCCTDKVTITTLIASARILPEQTAISPTVFITEDSARIITQFIQFKRYGLSALYGDDGCPHIILQAFDIVQNMLDKKERDHIRSMRSKQEKDMKQSPRGRKR